MNTEENYTNKFQKQMDTYKDKLSKIDNLLKNLKSKRRSALLSQREHLQDTFDAAEKILRNVTASSEEIFEKIKENAVEIFQIVKDAFHEFSNFLTMEQFYRTKDETIDSGSDKLGEVKMVIQNPPLTAAACTLGVGFLICAILTLQIRR